MAYKIETKSLAKMTVATMTLTIPEYSSDLYLRALNSLKEELNEMGISITQPEYIFTTTADHDPKIELIDLELVVAVEESGIDTNLLKFKELEEEEFIVRISSDSFTDIHTGLAEWMHDNDYAADGDLRHVISDTAAYVYDSPVKPANN